MNDDRRMIQEILGPYGTPSVAGESDFSRLKYEAPFELPALYLEFLEDFHGASGFIGPNKYISLWDVQSALEHNKGYMVREFAPDIFLIGTDGGGNGYGIRASGEFVEVPLIGMASDDALPIGNTFVEMLQKLRNAAGS
jgi:hypothetical protein